MEVFGSVTTWRKKNRALTGGPVLSVAERREGRECARLGREGNGPGEKEGSWVGCGEKAERAGEPEGSVGCGEGVLGAGGRLGPRLGLQGCLPFSFSFFVFLSFFSILLSKVFFKKNFESK